MSNTFESQPSAEQRGEDSYITNLAENYQRGGESLKVKKIRLLEDLGLPIPKTGILRADQLDFLEEKIREIYTSNLERSMIIRFGCVPDQFSMPSVVIESDSNIGQAINEVSSYVSKNQQIKEIVLQELTSEADAPNKISGRLLFEKSDAYPREEVLELYKGARNTNILNNVDTSDTNFLHFEKNIGHYIKLSQTKSDKSTFKESEIKDIYNLIQGFHSKLDSIKKVVAKQRGVKEEDFVLCIEFSYLHGRLVFSDIDY